MPKLAFIVLPLILATAVQAQDIQRFDRHETLPIAKVVKVPKAADTLYLSGEVASRSPALSGAGEPGSYGDTEAQTISVFEKITQTLSERGYELGDVVKLTVFLVGVPERGGRLDMQGFTRAYLRYFGTVSQRNLPARTTVQVAGLADPEQLVEIEAVVSRVGDTTPRGKPERP